jgi:hypothetical protein
MTTTKTTTITFFRVQKGPHFSSQNFKTEQEAIDHIKEYTEGHPNSPQMSDKCREYWQKEGDKYYYETVIETSIATIKN